MFRAIGVGTACVMLVSACATSLPEPTAPGRSLLVVSFHYRSKVGFATSDGDLNKVSAYIRKMGPNGPASTIRSNLHDDKYFFFPNVEPGSYQIVSFVITLPGGTNSAPVGTTGVTISTTYSRRDGSFEFAEDVVWQTTVVVSPRAVVYMGDFTGTARLPFFVTGAISVSDPSGQRTAEAEAEALDYVVKNFPKSVWGSIAARR